ncbi:MAG: hypothetical protein KF878_16065 [Planctomycetes bacterium]|nr:hypothetical protein [Planctomycetota bacterium]
MTTPARLVRSSLLALTLGLVAASSGCVALLDAGVRETQDDGRRARYENKSFGGHFVDALVEQDDCRPCRRHSRCDRHTTVVVVHEGRRRR